MKRDGEEENKVIAYRNSADSFFNSLAKADHSVIVPSFLRCDAA